MISKRLEDYIVTDDVVVTDETAAWRAASFLEVGTETTLSAVPAAGAFVRDGGALVWHGRRAGRGGFDVLSPAAEEDAWRLRFAVAGVQEADHTQCEQARISAGVPAVPANIGPDDLPNEGGLDEDAIFYTKGCLLGQEVMARLKNLGHVRRRLLVVAGLRRPAGRAGAALPSRPAGRRDPLDRAHRTRRLRRAGHADVDESGQARRARSGCGRRAAGAPRRA